MNISERSVDFDTYSATKDPFPFLVDVIETRPLAPTGDPLVDTDSVVQYYHTMKQLTSESNNNYRTRMENKVRILQWLGLDVPCQPWQAMRFLFFLGPIKNADMIADLKNDAKHPDTTYPVDLVSMCDLATNWSSKSGPSRNHVPASGVVSNTRAKDDN